MKQFKWRLRDYFDPYEARALDMNYYVTLRYVTFLLLLSPYIVRRSRDVQVSSDVRAREELRGCLSED